jgi:hypothetical protein
MICPPETPWQNYAIERCGILPVESGVVSIRWFELVHHCLVADDLHGNKGIAGNGARLQANPGAGRQLRLSPMIASPQRNSRIMRAPVGGHGVPHHQGIELPCRLIV